MCGRWNASKNYQKNMIYVFCFTVFVLFFIIEYKYPSKGNVLFNIGSFLVVCLLALRKETVGADTISYMEFFKYEAGGYSLLYEAGLMEPGLPYYNVILRTICNDSVYYLFCNAIISLAPIYFLIKKYSTNKNLSLCFFFAGSSYVIYFVALRQILGISFILWGVYILLSDNKRKWLYFIILTFIGGIFHQTSILVSILLIICYFLPTLKRNFLVTTLVLAICLNLFAGAGLYRLFFETVQGYLLGGGDLLEKVSVYTSDSYTTQGLTKIFGVINLSIVGLLYLFVVDNDKLATWFTKVYWLYLILYNIFIQFPMQSRLLLGLNIISIIAIPTFLTCTRQNIDRRYLKLFMIFICLYHLRNFVNAGLVDVSSDGSALLYPYLFFFE